MQNLKTATINVRTLSDECHLQNLLHETENINWDLIGLSKVRRIGEEISSIYKGLARYPFSQRKRKSKLNGTGFSIHKKLKNNIKNFDGISDRVTSVTIKLSNKYYLKVVQVYNPTSTSTQEALHEFYNSINEAIEKSKTHYLIVMGDFNAKIGFGNEKCLGKFSYEIRNERGEDLTNLAVSKKSENLQYFISKEAKPKMDLEKSKPSNFQRN